MRLPQRDPLGKGSPHYGAVPASGKSFPVRGDPSTPARQKKRTCAQGDNDAGVWPQHIRLPATTTLCAMPPRGPKKELKLHPDSLN